MYKYREGKVQSTLERELNVPETAVMQAYGTCAGWGDWCVLVVAVCDISILVMLSCGIHASDSAIVLLRLSTRVDAL